MINNNLRNSRNDGKLVHLTDKNQKSSPEGVASFSEQEDDVVSEIVMGYDQIDLPPQSTGIKQNNVINTAVEAWCSNNE